MFTLRRLFAVLAAMAIALVTAPSGASAQSSSDPNYPDCLDVSITLSPAHPVLLGGGKTTITAEVRSNVDPQPTGTLRIMALGKTYTFHSNRGTITITTPVVTKRTTANISASYTLSHGGTSKVCYIDPADALGVVTLLPPGTGALPNTGGTNLWYVVWGGLLLGVGVAIVGTVNARRAKKLL